MKLSLPRQVRRERDQARRHFHVGWPHLLLVILACANGVSISDPNQLFGAETSGALIQDSVHQSPTVVFRYEGQVVAKLGYLHLHLNIDVVKPIEQLTALEILLQACIAEVDRLVNASFTYDQLFDTPIAMERETYKNQLITVQRLRSDLETVRSLGEAPQEDFVRQQRKLMAFGLLGFVASTFMGIFTQIELEMIRNRMDSQENRITEIVHDIDDIHLRMSQHSKHIATIENLLDHHTLVISTIQRSVGRQALIASLVQNAMVHTNNVMSATQSIFNKRLSPLIMQPNAMGTALSEIREEARKQGFQLLAKTVADIYQCEVSFLTTDTGFELFVHVPLAKDDEILNLHLHLPIPIELPNDKMLLIKPPQRLIATDAQKSVFRTMEPGDLTACKQMGGIYLCDNSNLVRVTDGLEGLDEPNACAFHLLKSNFEAIQRICPMVITDPINDAIAVTPSEFYFMSVTDHQADVFCGKIHQRSFPARRVTHQKITPGCTAKTRSHTVTAAVDVLPKGVPVAYNWPDSNAFVLRNLTPEQVQAFTNSLEAFKHIPEILRQQQAERKQLETDQALIKEQRGLQAEIDRAIEEEKAYRTPTIAGWIVTGTLCIIGLLAATAFLVWYKRNGDPLRQLILLQIRSAGDSMRAGYQAATQATNGVFNAAQTNVVQ